jgi:integrase/recombinase XerD
VILFAAEHTQRKPCALTVADLDRDLVLAFFDDLETKRQNAVQTRNMRLAAIRSGNHPQTSTLIALGSGSAH